MHHGYAGGMGIDRRAAGLCLMLLTGCAQAQRHLEVASTLQKAAQEIHELDPLDIGGYPRFTPFAKQASYPDAVVRLAATNYPTDALVSLLPDKSPKVRTLALELLFRKQDPQLLPIVHRLVEDSAITFEHIVQYNFRANGPPDWKREPLKVGAYAQAFLNSFGVEGDFEKFWATHKDRRYWYGWLRAEMLRRGGMSSPNPGVMQRLKPLRERIEGLPETERNLYLIWLQSEYREPALATDAEIGDAVHRLGRENILALAELHMPSGDPDLQFSADSGRFRYVTESILDRAQKELTRADGDRMLTAYTRQKQEWQAHHDMRDNGPGVVYPILRARLLPDRAGEILQGELDGRPCDGDRARLVATLLQLRRRAEIPFARTSFYNCGLEFTRLAQSDIGLVEEILTDRRLGGLHPGLMADLVKAFPHIRPGLLVAWWFQQKENSSSVFDVQYFLRILKNTCNQATYREILRDPRLDRQSLSMLVALEQELPSSKIPKEIWAEMTRDHEREILGFFAVNSDRWEPSPAAVTEFIRFLRKAAPYVRTENVEGGCRP